MDAEANVRVANGPKGKRQDCRASSSLCWLCFSMKKNAEQELDFSLRWNDGQKAGRDDESRLTKCMRRWRLSSWHRV
jgi:hypothetical protein